MQSDQIRQRYLDFFVARGHTVIPGASLIPENDASVLFTTAGMQPLVPFFSGTRHPAGQRLVDWQRCLRTVDIDEVGDSSHLTCFEMLGNWSLGDYFKQESLSWCWEFLTTELGLDPDRLAVTVFAGDEDVPADTDSAQIWRDIGLTAEQIFAYPKSENFWGPPGITGPCGPDSEIFYWTGSGKPIGGPADDQRWLEVWNSVSIQYYFDGTNFQPLGQDNIDTGLGLERLSALLQNVGSVYETDLFTPIMQVIAELANVRDLASERIIADHVRAGVFLLADGVRPGNVEQGYIARRLLRRAIRHGRLLDMPHPMLRPVAEAVIERFRDIYPQIVLERDAIITALDEEEQRFGQTLQRGLAQLAQYHRRNLPFDGQLLFHLYETDGLPLEVSLEELTRLGVTLDHDRLASEWAAALAEHRQRSRQGMERKFSGGLADHSAQVVRQHTATHLLNAALRQTLGQHVHQRGSNITEERLRFDFSHSERLSDDERQAVEQLVNDWISQDLLVERRILPRAEAELLGAEMEFSRAYPEQVSVYQIGDVSLEFCGGPHVGRTGEIGQFQLGKQESVGAGIRRLKASITD